MRALTLHQPWASLIARGVKRIETRSWSTRYRGPLAIHAGASIEGLRALYFDYEDGWAMGTLPGDDRRVFGWQRIDGEMHVQVYVDGAGPAPLPLGAIVATCTLVDVVPIVGPGDGRPVAGEYVCNNYGGALWLVGPENVERIAPGVERDMPDAVPIGDQRPYGDFRPGRYAWLLDDIAPTTERCPACWGSGDDPLNEHRSPAEQQGCGVCWTAGTCDPIPAKGKQGLWEWAS